MAKNAGRSKNTYDAVSAPLAIPLNTATYTTIAVENNDRLGYKITNDTAHDILVKEQAFDVPDALDRGFQVFKRSVYESKPDNVAIGEISAKALSGSPSILFVEE
jgi:hypothetical protein